MTSDIRGSQNSKSGSRDPHMTPFDLILQILDISPRFSICVSNLTQIASSLTDIWLFYDLADFAAKCLFGPILGSFGGF